MKKLSIIMSAAVFLSAMLFVSCSRVSADINEEVVFDKHPIFGVGGIDETPLKEGSCFISPYTEAYKFSMTPTRYEENFENLFTSDRTAVNLNAFITLQIQKGKTPILLRNFGVDWYKNSIQEPFREIVRNKLCAYTMLELVSGRDVYESSKNELMLQIEQYINKMGIPIDVVMLVISKVNPPKEVRDELNILSQEQAKEQNQKQRLKTEEARFEAELARAKADKSFMTEMGFTQSQYIQYLRAIALQNRSDVLRVENVDGVNSLF